MSSQDIPEENLPAEQAASDDEHEHGAVGVADEKNPFADPGLPPHEHRVQDIDERAAKRSERAVAFLFTLSMLATVALHRLVRGDPGRQDRSTSSRSGTSAR